MFGRRQAKVHNLGFLLSINFVRRSMGVLYLNPDFRNHFSLWVINDHKPQEQNDIKNGL